MSILRDYESFYALRKLQSAERRINEPRHLIDFGANFPFSSLNATASIGQRQQRALCQSFFKTRHRVGHRYLVLRRGAAQPRVTQSNHILGTSDTTTNKCAADVRHHHRRSKQADAARKQEKDEGGEKREEHATNRQFGQTKQSSFDSGRVQNVSVLEFSLAE